MQSNHSSSKVDNNGNVDLPNGLLFEVTALPRGSHINLVVNIAYAQGCPPLVNSVLTPLTFSGLCGACNTEELQIGHPAVDRGFVDGATSTYFIDPSNMCFASDGLLTSFQWFAKRQSRFTLVIFRPPASGNLYQVVSYPLSLETTTLGQTTYHLSPALPVKAGDCIGWHHTGRGVFAFDVGGGSTVRWRFNELVNVGSTVDFNGAQARSYSILTSYVV